MRFCDLKIMQSNNQENRIAGAITFPSQSAEDMQPLPNQPRQPRNLQGLLRFAMEATKAEDAPGNSDLGPMDEERRKFLEHALKSLTVDLADIVQKSIKILTDSERMRTIGIEQNLPEDVNQAFENLMEYVDDIDIANDFYKVGGFAVFPICYSSENEQLRTSASSLLAELCQNNPFCQARALECGLLGILLHLTESEQGTALAKNIYAVSCMVREFEPACEALIKLGGCNTLQQALKKPETSVRTKAAFLIRYLCQHYTEAKEQFIANNLPKALTDVLKSGRDCTTEHIVGTFLALLEGLDPDAFQLCRDPELGLKRILETNLKHPDINLEEFEEEKEYTEELLRVLFEKWSPVDEVVDALK